MPGSFVSQFDPAHGKRVEFGELVRQSGRMLNKRSLDQVIGAENLLAKAMAGVAAGGVGTTWAAIEGDWVIPSFSEGHGFQIRAYGKAVNSNGVTWHVWLDNVRGEGPSS